MNERIHELRQRISQLQNELEEEFEQRRATFRYHLEARKVRFEQQVIETHRQLKTSLWRFIIHARLRDLALAPVIYAMLLPLLLLDLMLFLYQAIYFRAYAIPRAKRSDYIVIDRHQLAYLNAIEKLNCIYCGYANGLFALAREVAARTERHWCPIKHAQRIKDPHSQYPHFFDYGDGENYRQQRTKLRQRMAQPEDPERPPW